MTTASPSSVSTGKDAEAQAHVERSANVLRFPGQRFVDPVECPHSAGQGSSAINPPVVLEPVHSSEQGAET